MDFQIARFNMVEQQIRPWDVLDFDLLDALADIPREKFVLPEQQNYAYADLALKLGNGSMMLEPKVVARMVQGLALKKLDQVLEVGTGSGYVTALLSLLSAHVDTYDVDEQQLLLAQTTLNALNYRKIDYHHADGLAGNITKMYDAIYVGGSLPCIPEALKTQLQPNGGRMVVIVGKAPLQHCMLITRQDDEYSEVILFDTCAASLNASTLPKGNQFTF